MTEVIEIRDCYGDILLRYPVAPGKSGLVGAVLEGAELSWAELARQDMEGVDLYWGRLLEANLEGANLRNADLRGADLTRANLRSANLEGADLGRDRVGGATSLKGANLEGANLRQARLEGASYDSRTTFPPGFSPEAMGMVLTSAD